MLCMCVCISLFVCVYVVCVCVCEFICMCVCEFICICVCCVCVREFICICVHMMCVCMVVTEVQYSISKLDLQTFIKSLLQTVHFGKWSTHTIDALTLNTYSVYNVIE